MFSHYEISLFITCILITEVEMCFTNLAKCVNQFPELSLASERGTEAFQMSYLQLPKGLWFHPHNAAMRAKPSTLS
jgi:hypothetical protein